MYKYNILACPQEHSRSGRRRSVQKSVPNFFAAETHAIVAFVNKPQLVLKKNHDEGAAPLRRTPEAAFATRSTSASGRIGESSRLPMFFNVSFNSLSRYYSRAGEPLLTCESLLASQTGDR